MTSDRQYQTYRKFAQLCTELKLLYVAITRPRNKLIIYDQDLTIRKPLQKVWELTNTIDVVTKAMAYDFSLIPESVLGALKLKEDQSIEQGAESLADIKMNWKLQGLKLFKVKYYNAAIQCFKNAGDEVLVKRC